MGLLDDPELLAALGAGFASSRNAGQGLLGATQNTFGLLNARNERQRLLQAEALKQELIRAQIGDVKAQEAQRTAQAERGARANAALQGLLGASGGPSQYGLEGGGIQMGGQREQMRPQAPGLAGASAEQIAALATNPDIPNASQLVELWKLAQTGQKMDPGAYYLKPGQRTPTFLGNPKDGVGIGPDGNVQAMPGAARALGEIAGATTGAQEAAKAPYQLVERFNTQTQAPEKVRLSEWPGGPNAVPSVGADQVKMDMLNPGTQYSSPAVRAMMERQFGGGSGGGIQTGPSMTDKARADTIQLGNQSFMKDSYTPALAAGDAAQKTLTSVQSARNALSGLKSGWGTETIAGAANVLAALGVPQAERIATNAQQFQTAAMDRLWTNLNAAKGPQTEGDADRASKTFARLANTPRANAFILDLTEAQAQKEKMRAAYFKQALPHAQQKGDLQEIERRWAALEPSIWTMPSLSKWGVNE